jgi:hypothetical protein
MRLDYLRPWTLCVSLVLAACDDDINDADTQADTTTDGPGDGDGETGDGDGDGDGEDTRLFDETGVWALDRYSLDGTPHQEINQGRKDRFLLRFGPDDAVVAAAACHEQGFEVDVNSSSCTNAALSTWSCQCFSYTYEGSQMIWQEFAPGDQPPPVGAVGNGGAHEVDLSAFGETAATYQLDSLPLGLFNSDGDLSKHVFQLVADTIWTTVDINDDGMLDLEQCSMLCFPSEA